MAYLITGGTGFIGKRLVALLARRGVTLYLLTRQGSEAKVHALQAELPDADIRILKGDLAEDRLGLDEAIRDRLTEEVDQLFHLAAIYDLEASAAEQQKVNVEGTARVVELANELGVRCLHHVSSIAAAGLYQGLFREDMFEEAERLDHPYFASKHESERLVRERSDTPIRIYRPGIVVGDSRTGEIDKIDGPYYFFKLIQRTRELLPPWMPTIGVEGGRINLVPVDYVARAIDHIAHQEEGDGECFHLVDSEPRRIGEVLNLFARAGHAPQMSLRIDLRMFSFVPSAVRNGVTALPPVRRVIDTLLSELGIPKQMLGLLNYPTRFDARNTERALAGTDISVPPLEDYAWKLWDYWERNLDPALFIDRSLRARVENKVVVVTGGSSGIGRATALMLGKSGARVVIIARKEEELIATRQAIEKAGGAAHHYRADLSDMESCDDVIAAIHRDLGSVDILINNAGRSIRRSIAQSFDRFHDFERTMQLNYFGALRLIFGVLPPMLKRRTGHIINISSIGVLSNAPRFSAYVASKAALDAFSRCAAAEFSDRGVNFTIINMPLVRTPMIEPTKIYRNVPMITAEDAADMVADAIVKRPQRIATRLGLFAQVLHAVAPKLSETVMNSAYRLFPDSAPGGQKTGEGSSEEQIAFASLMRGIHW